MRLRIRDLREDSELKQETLAQILNVSQTTYSRYESGILDIPAISLETLSQVYNTSVDYLLGITDEKKPYKR